MLNFVQLYKEMWLIRSLWKQDISDQIELNMITFRNCTFCPVLNLTKLLGTYLGS